jgi:hypothetical protein
MKKEFAGRERRKFVRLKHNKPLAFKVCKKKTVSSLLNGYTHNVSQSGLFCNLRLKVAKHNVLWLCFDRSALSICQKLEDSALIYQNGIIGKVVWVKHKQNGTYDVGIKFLTRREKNLTNIYPKFHFVEVRDEKK